MVRAGVRSEAGFHVVIDSFVSAQLSIRAPHLLFVSHSGTECGGHRGRCPGNTDSPRSLDFWHLVCLQPRIL